MCHILYLRDFPVDSPKLRSPSPPGLTAQVALAMLLARAARIPLGNAHLEDLINALSFKNLSSALKHCSGKAEEVIVSSDYSWICSATFKIQERRRSSARST